MSSIDLTQFQNFLKASSSVPEMKNNSQLNIFKDKQLNTGNSNTNRQQNQDVLNAFQSMMSQHSDAEGSPSHTKQAITTQAQSDKQTSPPIQKGNFKFALGELEKQLSMLKNLPVNLK